MREILLGLAVVVALAVGIGVSYYGGIGKLSPRDQAYLDEMKQLRKFFGQVTDQPFNPPLPDHLYRVLTDQSGRPVSALFLHFAKPVGSDQSILYIGDAVPGRFCDTPEVRTLMAQGYVHFHANQAPSIEAGHGNPAMPAGTEGWWLRHIAVGDKTMMGTQITPGTIDFQFMPSPLDGKQC